jgi:hypothetical protein
VQIFCDVTDVSESGHIQYRCANCHADGAMNCMAMTLEEKNCKLAEEDNLRDLFYIVASPTPRNEVGDDTRTLHVDLKRPLLPAIGNIKQALNEYKTQGNTPETRSNLRRVMFDTITENANLADLLASPELQLVRDRLIKLTSHHTDIECENKVAHLPDLFYLLSHFMKAYTSVCYRAHALN